jgi:hypothetical protein
VYEAEGPPPLPGATTEPATAEGAGSTEAGPPADAALVARIRELRGQDPPTAWTAIASELGLSDYALRKLRQDNNL